MEAPFLETCESGRAGMSGESLTKRETEVARLVAAGKTNREAAATMGISEQAVKNLLQVVYEKYGVRNRVELTLLTFKNE